MLVSTPTTITFVPGAVPDGDHYRFMPCFRITRGDEVVGNVWVRLTGSAVPVALGRLGAGREQLLDEAVIEYGVSRLVAALSAPDGEGRLFGQDKTANWTIHADDVPGLIAEVGGAKRCDYQHQDGRDLLCLAAGKNDETVVAVVGWRRAAPTSRPVCANCNLPDTQTICSHLLHPSVIGRKSMGSTLARGVFGALCDLGKEEIRDPSQCRAGGHDCWQRVVVTVEEPPSLVSPLTLPEALDFLDATWRLAFGKRHRLLNLSTTSEPAGLALPASSSEEFEARISDLADVLDRLFVPDDLIPATASAQDKDGSLNRLRTVLLAQPNVSPDVVERAVRTLQRIRGLRHTRQHSRVAADLPRLLSKLGLGAPSGDWSGLWNGVKARTVTALIALRAEVRRVADDEAGSPHVGHTPRT